MKGKVTCPNCGWSWNKSESSQKDMHVCHNCGKSDVNMKNGGWLDNYNDSQASAPEGMVGDGYSNVGRNYSPAWGGQFQMGGDVYPVNYVPQAQGGMSMPGATGSMYARIGAPSNGPYAKKTLPSAQNGQEMQYYREGLDFKPKTISKNGGWLNEHDVAQPGKKIKIKDERLQGQVTKDQLEDRKVFSQNVLASKKPAGKKQIKQIQKDAANPKVVVFAESPMESSTYNIFDDEVNQISELKQLQDEYRNSLKEIDSVAMADETYKTLNDKVNKAYEKVHKLTTKYNSEDPRTIAAFKEYIDLSEGVDNYKEVGLRDKLDPYRKKLNKLNAKFYQSPLNPKVMDSTFYKEAQNVKDFYNRTDPNTKVDVVPMYNQPELMQRKLKGMSQFDKAAIFGHSGDALAGIPNNDIAKYLSNSRVNDCYFGSCGFESNIEDSDLKDMKGKTLNYRPTGNMWLGFNPNAKTFDEGMWSRNLPENFNTYDDAKVIPLKKGVTHVTNKLQYGGEIAQDGKKFKLKDDRGLVMKPAESTNVKRKDFDIEQSKSNKAYLNQVVAQKKEAARRAKLTQDQREREDYNAYNEEHGSVNKYTPETNWERTKSVVSNPLTAAGYMARGENLPGNFQVGPRNDLDYALDWVNPLQGAVSVSNIPGQLGRGEYMDAGLSALDALDLGVYAKAAKKAATPLVKKGIKELGNIKTSVAPELRQSLNAAGVSLNDLNPFKFKPKSNRLYSELDDKNTVEEFLGKTNITNAQKKIWNNSPSMKSKYLLEADPSKEVFSNGLSTYDIPLDHLQGSNIYKKNWLGNYKRIEPVNYFGFTRNGEDLNPFIEPQKVQYSDFIHPEQAADLAHETRNDYENLFGMSMPESPARSNDLYPDVSNNWMTDAIERNAMKDHFYQKSMMPESWEGFYDKFRGNYDWDIKHFPERKAEFDLNFTDITPEEKSHLFSNIQKQKDGGIIDSDRGQWDYPGQITEIDQSKEGSYIDMGPDPKTGKPITQNILAISDTGDVRLMRPGGKYKLDGKRVTEYPIAQTGKDIKLKNKKGEVETINTASPEYEKIYKAGEIQSSDANGEDVPFFGGQIEDVAVQQQMTPLLQAKKDYGNFSNKDAFFNRKKDEYIKSLGSRGNWFGADRNNMPEDILRGINNEYEYNKNNYVAERLAKERGFNLDERGDWLYDLTPAERESISNSKYSGYLNPNEFSEMASGIQQLGNTALPGKPFNFDIPGLTSREEEEDRDSSLSALKTFAPLNMPGNLVANYLKNSSDYVDNPWLGMSRMGNVDAMDSMALNPLNIGMITGAANLPNIISKGAKTLGTVVGENANNIKKVIPNVKEVVKQLPKAIKNGKVQETVFNAMPDEFKQTPLGQDIKANLDQRKVYNDMKKDINKTLDVEGRDQIRYDWIQGPYDLSSEVDAIQRNFRRTMHDVGGSDFANKAVDDITKFQANSPAYKRFREIVFQNSYATEDEMKSVLKEIADNMPKATDYAEEAKKVITLKEKGLIYNKKDVENLKAGIKATGKNVIDKIKGKDTDVSEAAPVNYSAEEAGTLDAIKELGKYRTLFNKDAVLAKSHPQTMENVNNLISKLDEDVVRNILGVGKQELIDSYKTISSNVKQAEATAAMAQKPFGINELQTIAPDQSNNPLRDLYLDKFDVPFSRDEPSLVSKINKRRATNNLGYEFEAPSSNPTELIHYVETSYDIKPIEDAVGNIIDPNVLGLSSKGNAKKQIKNAFNIVNNALPGENVMGSESLSTDSYALTLDAALAYVKKGRLAVKVDPDVQQVNSMGYANRFPGLALKDINSKIEALEKASGKKIPRAKWDAKYQEYDFPKIYFTKIKKNGGYIDKAKHGNQLVKLDQLTNFTNYNKPQPGGWLSKYE